MRWTLAALLVPALAAAASVAEEGGGANNPFAGDIGTALWTLVIFVAVVLVLGRFAWGPILATLQNREAFIRDSLAQAKRDREEAELRLKEYADKLATARAEATALVEEGRRDAEVVKRKIEEDARQEGDKLVARARREIGLAKDTAVKELYGLSAHLATGVAERLLRRELSSEDHQRLIAESLRELEELERN